MGRIVTLSVSVVLTLVGTGVAVSNWTNNYDLYNTPSSASLGPIMTSTSLGGVGLGFGPAPVGGFGPSTASFRIPDSASGIVQTPTTLKFSDRWLFDTWTGGPPRRRRNHAGQRHRAQSLWALIGLGS